MGLYITIALLNNHRSSSCDLNFQTFQRLSDPVPTRLIVDGPMVPYHLLSVPRHNLSFGARAFRVSAPKIMELLTSSHAPVPNILFFHHLKTHYPILPLAAPIMHTDSLLRLWRYINPLLTYLLTSCPCLQVIHNVDDLRRTSVYWTLST